MSRSNFIVDYLSFFLYFIHKREYKINYGTVLNENLLLLTKGCWFYWYAFITLGAQAVQEVNRWLSDHAVQARGYGGEDRVCASDAAPGRPVDGWRSPSCLRSVRHRQEDCHRSRSVLLTVSLYCLLFLICLLIISCVLCYCVGFEVCNDALQMLGGYGYLKVDYCIIIFPSL